MPMNKGDGAMTVKQLYYEEVEVGQEIQGFSLELDSLRMSLHTSGSQDFNPPHQDVEYVRSTGVPDIFVNTGFIRASLERVLTDWIGDEGWLRKLSFRMIRMNMPGDIMTCKGKVTNKYIEENVHYVECDVWVENQREGVSAPCKATVTLPSKA